MCDAGNCEAQQCHQNAVRSQQRALVEADWMVSHSIVAFVLSVCPSFPDNRAFLEEQFVEAVEMCPAVATAVSVTLQ